MSVLTTEERAILEAAVLAGDYRGAWTLASGYIDRLVVRVEKLERVAEAAARFADEVDRQFSGTAIPAEIDTLRDTLAALDKPGDVT